MAEMWVSESGFAHWREAGVQLIGYAIRTVRPRAYAGKPAVAPPLEDADGREIFLEQIPSYMLTKGDGLLACPPYCAKGSPPGSREAGGGQPTVVMDRIVAGTGNVAPAGWLVDSNGGGVRLQSVRLEGAAGIMRNTLASAAGATPELLCGVPAVA